MCWGRQKRECRILQQCAAMSREQCTLDSRFRWFRFHESAFVWSSNFCTHVCMFYAERYHEAQSTEDLNSECWDDCSNDDIAEALLACSKFFFRRCDIYRSLPIYINLVKSISFQRVCNSHKFIRSPIVPQSVAVCRMPQRVPDLNMHSHHCSNWILPLCKSVLTRNHLLLHARVSRGWHNICLSTKRPHGWQPRAHGARPSQPPLGYAVSDISKCGRQRSW